MRDMWGHHEARRDGPIVRVFAVGGDWRPRLRRLVSQVAPLKAPHHDGREQARQEDEADDVKPVHIPLGRGCQEMVLAVSGAASLAYKMPSSAS